MIKFSIFLITSFALGLHLSSEVNSSPVELIQSNIKHFLELGLPFFFKKLSQEGVPRDVNVVKKVANPNLKKALPEPGTCRYPVIILILDASGSMQGSRFNNLDLSSKRIISFLPEKSRLAIIVFGTSANVTLHTLEITESSRAEAIAALPTYPNYGYTSIGGALQAANNIMTSEKEMECAQITLITDGGENIPPYMKNISQIIPHCANLHCIAFGASADKKLEQFCNATSSVSDVTSKSTLWKTEWDSIYSSLPSCSRLIRLPVKTVKVNETKYFYVDKGFQYQLHWMFTAEELSNFNITVQSPSGRLYGEEDFVLNPALKALELKFPMGENGRWAVTVTESVHFRKQGDLSEDSVLVFVTAKESSSDNSSILINAQLSNHTLDYNIQNVKIFARLAKGDDVVISAEVKAVITSPMNESDVKVIHLRDDGLGADLVKDDGIYSRFLTAPLKKLPGGMRYEVSVMAEGVKGTRIRSFGEGTQIFKKLSKEDLNSFEECEPFEGEITAGSIRPVNDYIEPLPFPIRDLQVNDVDLKSQLVSLSWTAPGLKLDEGTALSYRLSVKPFPLEDNRATWQKGDLEIVRGAFDPLPSGSFQNVTFKIPDELWQVSFLKSDKAEDFPLLYFKIQAEGSNGRFSDSNVASTEQYIMQMKLPVSSGENDEKAGKNVFIGILVLTCISSIPVYICLRHLRRRPEMAYQACDKREPNAIELSGGFN